MEEKSTELVLIETVDIASAETSTAWPMFTPDNTSRYSFFVSLPNGLYNISLNPWISNLEDELINSTDSGAGFRLDIILDSNQTQVSRILSRDTVSTSLPSPACISILDSDLGHFILTSTSSQPQAAILDLPIQNSIYTSMAPDTQTLALPAPEPRQPYQPSPAFSTRSTLPAFLESITASAQTRLKRTDLKTSIRFSPATLQLLTDAHRVLSTETSRLGTAAADLFRRCERMRVELAEQVRKVDEIASRIEAVTGDDDDAADVEGARAVGKEKIEQRMQSARTKERDLNKRVEALRRKMAGLGGKELSAREEAWREEVSDIEASLGSDEEKVEGTLAARLDEVGILQREVLKQVKEATAHRQSADGDADAGAEGGDDLSASQTSVPLDFRKQKIGQVMALLERETALVDAVAERLGRLGGIGKSGSSLLRSTSSLL